MLTEIIDLSHGLGYGAAAYGLHRTRQRRKNQNDRMWFYERADTYYFGCILLEVFIAAVVLGCLFFDGTHH